MFPHEFMHEACAFIDIERENVVPVVDFVEGLEVDGFAAADRPGEVGSGSDVVGVVERRVGQRSARCCCRRLHPAR